MADDLPRGGAQTEVTVATIIATMPQHNTSAQHVYVVTLTPIDRRPDAELRGRMEHVVSGRRRDFDTGIGLLACLAHEESLLGPSPPAEQTPPQQGL